MRITSRVYANTDLKFGDTLVSFKNGFAEVSEELFEEIVNSKFPNIYKEGEAPGFKTSERVDFDKAIKDVNQEYMAEIERLKKINNLKAQEVKELSQQLENLKISYDKDVKALQVKLSSVGSQSSEEVIEEKGKEKKSIEDEEVEIRKDLEAMKLPELQKLAEEQGAKADIVKKSTKKELIDLIMGKTE